MIEEKEPVYFKEFRNLVVKRFDQLEVKIEKEVETLALSTANEFRRIDEKFDAVDQRLDVIDERLDAMDQRFDAIDQRLDVMDQRFDRMEIRFEGVENTCDGLVYNVAEIKKSIQMIEVYIGRYEVRAINFEQILLQDFKPRILALEKLA